MSTINTPTTEASVEQIQYAKILEKGMFAGLLLMIITFGLYVSGFMQPLIPLQDIPTLWTMKSGAYLAKVQDNYLPEGHVLKVKVQAKKAAALKTLSEGHEVAKSQYVLTGWSWTTLLGYSDFLNFLPVAILAGITILCYGVIIPGLFVRGDMAMAIMSIVEILILVLAASGILRVGGH